jgi:surface antigen
MKIKAWQYILFLGSIAAIVVYIKRRTIGKYAMSNEAVRSAIARFAVQWVGTEEVGNNNGFANSLFQDMMKKIGWYDSAQWCMYFAKMVHYNTFPNDKANINKVLNGSSQSSYDNAKNDKTGTYTVATTPQVGDIIIFRHTNSPDTGHAGVVVEVNNDNTVTTIEGNTNDKNISDGDLVAKKKRTSVIGKSIGGDLVLRGFIRKVNLLS